MKISFAIAAALASTGAAAACPGLAVDDAWIRAAPPGATMTAAYARLSNTGDKTLVVDGARSRDFGGAQLHRTVVEDGVSRMRESRLEMAPGTRAALEPGGWHLMLFGATRSLTAGERVSLTLTCGKGEQDVPFTVKAFE